MKLKKSKSSVNYNSIINIILTLILFVLWVNVIFIHRMVGSVSWTLLKLVFAPIGVIIITISLVLLAIGILKKKNIFHRSISLLLSIALAFPILMLINIIPIAYPAKSASISPAITIPSPFNEDVEVGWGGDTVKNNAPHVIWASERWAYDLITPPANIGSNRLQDYGIYDKDVFSPVAGVVVEAYDKEEDTTPNTENFKSMEGNHVYIKIDKTQTFLLLNHLKKDSVNLKIGDHIEIGDFIGKVGNSGSTSEPHLHIHHQKQDPTKTLYLIFAEGLPLYFYDENGYSTMPIKGTIIKGNNNKISYLHLYKQLHFENPSFGMVYISFSFIFMFPSHLSQIIFSLHLI